MPSRLFKQLLLTAMCSLLRVAAADAVLLTQHMDMMISTLAVLHLQITEPQQQMQVVELTGLTSLTLEGICSMGTWLPAGDELTVLQSLADLETLQLSQFQTSKTKFQRLQSLCKLTIDNCYTVCYDMTSCTQITSLAICWSDTLYKPDCVLLPTGSSVQLRHLSISGDDNCRELRNVQDASQLTSITMHHTYPDNLREATEGWSTSMPCLKTIKAVMVP